MSESKRRARLQDLGIVETDEEKLKRVKDNEARKRSQRYAVKAHRHIKGYVSEPSGLCRYVEGVKR